MTPEFKPLAQALLQARLDGRLNCGAEFLSIVHQFDLKWVLTQEVHDFIVEIRNCDDLQRAQEVASKYNLVLGAKL